MAGDEDDGKGAAPCRQRLVEFEAALPGHPHVEHETARPVGRDALQEFPRRRERLNAIARQSQQALQAASHGEIVVHDEDGWLGLSHAAGAPTSGKMKWKVAPPPALCVAQLTPPLHYMNDRASASPIRSEERRVG